MKTPKKPTNQLVAILAVFTIIAGAILWYVFLNKESAPDTELPSLNTNLLSNSLEGSLEKLWLVDPRVVPRLRWDLASGRITPLFATQIAQRVSSGSIFSAEINQFRKNDALYGSGHTLKEGDYILGYLSLYAGLTPSNCKDFYEARFWSGSDLSRYQTACEDQTFFVDFLSDSKRSTLSSEDAWYIKWNIELYQKIIAARKEESFECGNYEREMFCPVILKGKNLPDLFTVNEENLKRASRLFYTDFWLASLYMSLAWVSAEQKITLFDEHLRMYRFFYTKDVALCETMTIPSTAKLCRDWTTNRSAQKEAYAILLQEYLESRYLDSYVRK
jgi:hypothetical protein